MRKGAILMGLAAALALVCASVNASAQTSRPSVSINEAAAASAAGARAAPQRRGLRLNESGRWGIDFNLSQPQGRDAQWGDVEAGAYFKLTPSIRVGGAVALGETNPALAARKAEPVEPAPRVRLETAFKF